MQETCSVPGPPHAPLRQCLLNASCNSPSRRRDRLLCWILSEKPLGPFTLGLAAERTGPASKAFVKKGVELAIGRGARRPRDGADQQGRHEPGRVSLSGSYGAARRPDCKRRSRDDHRGWSVENHVYHDACGYPDSSSQMSTTERIVKTIRLLIWRSARVLRDQGAENRAAPVSRPHAGEHGLFGDEEQVKNTTRSRPGAGIRHGRQRSVAGRHVIRESRARGLRRRCCDVSWSGIDPAQTRCVGSV